MKVLIVSGSRKANADHLPTVRDALREVDADCIIHGDAKGVDTMAAEHGRARGLVVIPMPAQWERHGKPAGMIRNRHMLAVGRAMADCGHDVRWLAFPSFESVGTRGFIGIATGVLPGRVIELT
jgi:hypothetical protein